MSYYSWRCGNISARSCWTKSVKFGLEIGHSGIKDVILPGEIRDIMNQVLIAEKKSQANVIMRREETASTRSLLNTAKLMEENEVLYRLKELEYIERISEKISQITLSGGTQIADQLREIFVPQSPEAKKAPEKRT
jgi:regulator of protease activity HflC (stomatin/prohibitin superfamily)